MNNGKLGFQDEYRFLSNFTLFDTPMDIWGLTFETSEHVYVACKTTDMHIRKVISEHPLKGIKKFGQGLTVRENWDRDKIQYMRHVLEYKFSESNPILRQKLIDTGDDELIEWNRWNDKFWGKCSKTGEGKNYLGKLLMQIRDEITGRAFLM